MSSSQGFASAGRRSIKRVLGFALMVFSVLGLVLSLLGLGVVYRVSGPVARSANDALALTVTALETTSQSLDLVHRTLGEGQDALSAMGTVMEGTGDGLQSTGALMGSLSDALGRDLTQVVVDSQSSLSAAEEGAAVIEGMLRGLNVISALTGIRYDPDVSLTESLALINESLDAVPDTLGDVDENLEAVQENLYTMETGFPDLTDTLEDTGAILEDAQTSVDEYRAIVQELTFRTASLQEGLPGSIRLATFGLYFVLIWLAISQIGLLWQGWEMVRYHPAQVETRLRELERKVDALLGHPKP